jgi:hypothetical protein
LLLPETLARLLLPQVQIKANLEITKGIGTCSITATKAADDNYNVANSDQQQLLLAKPIKQLLHTLVRLLVLSVNSMP